MILALLVVGIFSLVVMIHELGHFIMARRNGIAVEEFGFGFPPRLVGRKFGQTLYSINLLPLGGFVKLKGEDADSPAPDSFGAAKFGAKVKVLLAGVVMNVILAFAVLLILCLTGLPPVVPNQFSVGKPNYAQPPQLLVLETGSGTPAARAGIRVGDVILSANGQSLSRESELQEFTKSHAGREVDFKVKNRSDSTERDVRVSLNNTEVGERDGYLGVLPLQTYKLRYGWWSPVVAAGLTIQLVTETLSGFGNLIIGLVSQGKVSAGVAGPVGIVAILSSLKELGAAYVAVFVVGISISLAVLNVLPLPALDGGRLALIVAQKVTGKAVSPRREALIHTIGFAAFMLLALLITIFDIQRLRH